MSSAPIVPAPGPEDDVAREGAVAVLSKVDAAPVAAVVLGSGFADVSQRVTGGTTLEYSAIPGFPEPSVPGHRGSLVLGRLGGVSVAAFSGRFHQYEGHALPVCALPVRLAYALGVRTLVLLASVGTLDPSVAPGTLVVVTDHVNLLGENPLRGWRRPDGTPAFVDLSDVYDRRLAASAREEAEHLGLRAADGIYAAVPGPSYETPAEVEYLRRSGATVVGMSVVPEAVPARALEMRVAALAWVANVAGARIDHTEVVRAGADAAGAVGRLLEEFVPASVSMEGMTDGQ